MAVKPLVVATEDYAPRLNLVGEHGLGTRRDILKATRPVPTAAATTRPARSSAAIAAGRSTIAARNAGPTIRGARSSAVIAAPRPRRGRRRLRGGANPPTPLPPA